MFSCMIGEMEGRDIETAGVPGSFLQDDYKKLDIHINMEGEMVNLIKDINPSYTTSTSYT